MGLADEVDVVLDDVDFIASDTHFGHENIIKYCRSDRFSDVDEMDEALKRRWNSTVPEDSHVLFLGDLAWFNQGEGEEKVSELYDSLNGDITWIRGDHDLKRPSGMDWHYSALVKSGERDYLAAHFPEETPDDIPGSGMPVEFREELGDLLEDREVYDLHGHHHNNHPGRYPLVDPEGEASNCSMELTDYRPVSLGYLERLIDEGERVDSFTYQPQN